jgi:hypothetical protein
MFLVWKFLFHAMVRLAIEFHRLAANVRRNAQPADVSFFLERPVAQQRQLGMPSRPLVRTESGRFEFL